MKLEFLDVCSDVTKTATKIPQGDYLSEGLYPIYDQGKDYVGGFSNSDSSLATNFPYIIFGDHTRVIKYVDNSCYIGADGVKLLKVINKQFLPKYVYYSMLANPVESQGYARHFKLLKETKINLVDIENQKYIIKQLDCINDAILLKENELKSLDELIKSRFIEMFKDKGYPLCSIRDVVDTKKISAKKMYDENDTIKYIDISSIDNENNIIIGNTPYTFKDAPSRAQQCLKENDILISTVRPNLRNIAIFNEGNEGFVGSSGFCVLRANKCNSQYLKAIVLTDKFTEDMVSLTTGANYPAIRDNDVLDYQMINAPIELQNEFAEIAQQIDKSKFVCHSKYFL